jgi:cytochrome c biogenesis factor
MAKILWGHFENWNSRKKHFLKCLALLFAFFCPRYSTSIIGKMYLNNWQKSVNFYTMVICYFFSPMICNVSVTRKTILKKSTKIHLFLCLIIFYSIVIFSFFSQHDTQWVPQEKKSIKKIKKNALTFMPWSFITPWSICTPCNGRPCHLH